MSWESVVQQKLASRAASISAILPRLDNGQDDENNPLSKGEEDITTLSSKIAKGEITAEILTRAAIRRTIKAQAETNCLTEPLFEDALKQARSLDEQLRETGEVVGPLHGIPMTLKDQFNVRGMDTTLGYVGRAGKPAEEDAVLVTVLKRLGAIFITKTTIPQSILWGETESPLWGLTTYPGRPELTPGGSSGGEAALLAMSGALIGWGTDIGGSIRGPSHMCGLFGLKPTSSRFPYAGVPVSHEGQSHVPSSIGPLARNLSMLTTVTREFLNAKPWELDPNVTPLPWREDLYQSVQGRPLKIGVIYDDGVVQPHPEIEQVVRHIATLLKQAGHELVKWDTSDHLACIEIMDQFYRADGGEDIVTEVERGGEPLIPHVAALVEPAKPISVYQYWQLSRQRTGQQQAYNKKWNDNPVDLIISPVLPHTAVPHRSARYPGYTKIWNFLDYTAMSFPAAKFGITDPEKGQVPYAVPNTAHQEYEFSFTPRNALDEWNNRVYNRELMDGLPIGIQIIGRRFEEEKVLGMAKALENLLN